MENFINKFIEQNVKGVDTYQHNGSIWLIFTNDKRWVIELTEDKTLWYNYTFFKSIFDFFSMDVVENQEYITKWVEETIINGVKHTDSLEWKCGFYIEDTIQNGVRHTPLHKYLLQRIIEDTIQNGVKRTLPESIPDSFGINDTIQNGVRHTCSNKFKKWNTVEDTIQNGVKETKISPTHTEYGDWLDGDERLGEIIKNGVKKTKPFNEYLNEAIEFGVIAKTP